MEKQRKTKIRKWDETQGAVETELEETGSTSEEIPGVGPVLSKNPLKGIEDLIEQNDNNLDGVINNLPEIKPAAQMTSEDVIEEEQKKESIRQKLQDMKTEHGRPVRGCIDCIVPERG